MSIKKCVNGSFVNDFYKEYGTDTDTITSLPKTIIGDGQPISSYTIKGNMTQSGTPTPSNPIYPTECGDKTANLFDKSTLQNGYTIASDTGLPIASEQRIATMTPMKIPQGTTAITVTYSSNNVGFMYSAFRNGTLIERVTTKASGSVLSLDNIDEIYFSWYKSGTTITTNDVTNIMVNTGSTAQTYEPYGYKIPILSNGVSYPIYLSEPIRKIGDSVDTAPSTGTAARNIRKYEFTGQEQWTESDPSTNTYRAYTAVDANLAGASGWCSHVPYIITGISYDNEAASVVNSRFFLRLSNTIANDITSFKQYLATQYAAGTPVTVWYVLATAQTESFTTPTLPTTGTAEQFNVLTTLAPSEVSLTYHGWHEHSDTKYTSG